MTDARKLSPNEKVLVKNAGSISGGDELRNINSYEYLLAVSYALQKICEEYKIKVIPKALAPLSEIYEEFQKNPNYEEKAYGDRYTRFILEFEDNLEKIKKTIQAEQHPTQAKFLEGIYHAGIETVYANPNKGLERAEKMVEDITEDALHTSNEIEERIRKRMETSLFSRSVNVTTPQYEGSMIGRGIAMVSSTYKPQSTTSMASIRTYHYKDEAKLPMEYRFGTQGQYHEGEARVSPLFKAFLEMQRMDSPKEITHIYFNNLSYDRSGTEGERERKLSMELHQLERDHPNVAVITLPADQGMMERHLLEDHHQSINIDDAIKKILAIADGTSKEPIKDFFISDRVKQLLYGSTQKETEVLTNLLNESFHKLGVDLSTRQTISPAEMQAVYFHFIKYELSNFIIEKLNPVSFNMSCKDAIDRGGVSSAYYNLMKSLEQEKPLSKDEFHRALHAAPTLVKGRGMNHHSKMIWNAIDMYLNNSKMLLEKPVWMIEWRDKNAPPLTKSYLFKKLEVYIENREKGPENRYSLFSKNIKVSASKKLNSLRQGKSVKFSLSEKEGLNEGELGKIYNALLKTGIISEKQIVLESPKISVVSRRSLRG